MFTGYFQPVTIVKIDYPIPIVIIPMKIDIFKINFMNFNFNIKNPIKIPNKNMSTIFETYRFIKKELLTGIPSFVEV